MKDVKPINYPVKKTGYYCVGTYGYSTEKYEATVVFRNSYGELPAAQIPKLPFYGGLTIVYAVIGAYGLLIRFPKSFLLTLLTLLGSGPSYMCKIDMIYVSYVPPDCRWTIN